MRSHFFFFFPGLSYDWCCSWGEWLFQHGLIVFANIFPLPSPFGRERKVMAPLQNICKIAFYWKPLDIWKICYCKWSSPDIPILWMFFKPMTMEQGCQNTASYTLDSTIISHVILLWPGSASLSVKTKKSANDSQKTPPKPPSPVSYWRLKCLVFYYCPG